MSHPRLQDSVLALATVSICILVADAGLLFGHSSHAMNHPSEPSSATEASQADPLSGAVSWINTSRPIRLADLRGKVVLLDFWTYCCINCHHVLPDLEYLEDKYPNELVVIGIHSPKFPAEKDTEQIRKKVTEYRIKHPIANDANQTIWRRFGVESWPTLVLISATGQVIGGVSGEGQRELLDEEIGKLVAVHKARNELNSTPFTFPAEVMKPHDEALAFPGKVYADAENKRLFISDTGHNRVVVTDFDGKHLMTIGSGEAALTDGSFEKAAFNRPQGLCLFEGKLYVADTENHAVRAVDLEARTVTTIAGTGEQSYRRQGGGKAKLTGLNSPWDLLPAPGSRTLMIAMAGPHQIWTLDLVTDEVRVWAGSGMENIIDGSSTTAAFAQPSGLATDGQFLYVADSEVSGIRAVSFKDAGREQVRTVVGRGLFVFGDTDGRGSEVRLQHCLGVAFADGKLYIADSYNNKIKVCEPKDREVKAFVGTREPGAKDDPPQFDQPGGLSIADGTLYVADTNNHAIRAIDLGTKAVRTLKLTGIAPPVPQAPRFPNAAVADLDPVEVAPGPRFTLKVTIPLPPGFKINPDGTMPYLLETPGKEEALDPVARRGVRLRPPTQTFTAMVPLARPSKPGEQLNVRLSVGAFICREGKEGICTVKNHTWNIPVKFVAGASETAAVRPAQAAAAGEGND